MVGSRASGRPAAILTFVSFIHHCTVEYIHHIIYHKGPLYLIYWVHKYCGCFWKLGRVLRMAVSIGSCDVSGQCLEGLYGSRGTLSVLVLMCLSFADFKTDKLFSYVRPT